MQHPNINALTTFLRYTIHLVNNILPRQETSSLSPSPSTTSLSSGITASTSASTPRLKQRQGLPPASALPPNSAVLAPGSSNPECNPYLYGSYYIPPSCQAPNPYAPASPYVPPTSTYTNGLYTPPSSPGAPNNPYAPISTYPIIIATPPASNAAKSSSTSAGAKAGIAIGAIAGVAALAAAGYFAYRWWKRRQAGLAQRQDQDAPAEGIFPGADEHDLHDI
ncbi:hypothetical protein MMC30_003754 [Trapelia coarctata]|nr:hypothetical protein [Trapelia coarctata]